MDHFAVARRCDGADRRLRLRDDHLVSGARDRARDPQPDNARTDDKHLHCNRPR